MITGSAPGKVFHELPRTDFVDGLVFSAVDDHERSGITPLDTLNHGVNAIVVRILLSPGGTVSISPSSSSHSPSYAKVRLRATNVAYPRAFGE